MLRFTDPYKRQPGIIEWLLNQSYLELVLSDPDTWAPERANWKETDINVFENPETIGRCTFLSWYKWTVVGFCCFDPRPAPIYGVVGHNCILPAYRNNGFGRMQILEVIRQFKDRGIRQARVSTNDHPYFIPAQRMYQSCGFREVARKPWETDTTQSLIYYEREIQLDSQIARPRSGLGSASSRMGIANR